MWTLLLACTSGRAPSEEPPAGQRAPLPPPPPLGSAQGEPLPVCINEFMPNNKVSALDESGAPSDWIELHNPTDQDVALDGWSLTDNPSEPRKHVLAGGLVLPAGGYLLLWADGETATGPTHLNFALSGGGEAVALFNPEGSGSIVWYGAVHNDLAVRRTTDCCFDETAGCFDFAFAGTPGAPNVD